jgi:two-component system cell cycle response regulator DivK
MQLPRLNDGVECRAFRRFGRWRCPEIPHRFLWQARPETPQYDILLSHRLRANLNPMRQRKFLKSLPSFPHMVLRIVASSTKESPMKTVFSMRRLKVLLVEDDDGARLLYSYMLALSGYRVKAVRNGLEAFAEIKVNRPDVVVTDIAMPIVSGLDLIVAVRSDDELADLPVVAITSFGEKLREQARAVGATKSVDKPTDITRMRELIEAAVSRSRN